MASGLSKPGDTIEMIKPTLAYLGVGLMGRPMAERLLAAGYSVHVWNRGKEKLAPLIAKGAIEAATPAAAVNAADIVLMCLMDSASVETVVFGPHGIVHGLGRDDRGVHKILVDHASIQPAATRDFAARLANANGMQWVDAPVSGGVSGAAAGSLAVMCGGELGAIERVTPVLRAYGANITRMGPVGAGQTTKLCNQILVATNLCVIAEAVRLAQNAGVDASMLPQALAGGWGDSKPLQVFVPRMVHPPENVIGANDTMLKDLDTALALGQASGTPMPIASLAAEIFRMLQARGWGDEEPSKLAALYK